jgi:hypothetical protein
MMAEFIEFHHLAVDFLQPLVVFAEIPFHAVGICLVMYVHMLWVVREYEAAPHRRL